MKSLESEKVVPFTISSSANLSDLVHAAILWLPNPF
jgi:hypothetical protein